ncbi:MAG: glycosyltransferase [Planctomycetota bacterium]
MIPLRVVTAAWPSPYAPFRARLLQELHLALGAGFPAEILAPRVHRDDPLDEERQGLRVRRFSYPTRGHGVRADGIGPIGALRYLLSARATARRIWRPRGAAGPDSTEERGIVIGHWVVPTGWIAREVSRRLDWPLILYAHGSDLNRYGKGRVGRRLVQQALRSARLVIAASEPLAEEVRRLGPTGLRVEVLPIGVSSEFLSEETGTAAPMPDSAPPPLRVLFVGDRLPAKGADLLEEAALRAIQRGATLSLTWIGDGPADAEHTVGERRGPCGPKEIAAAMRDAHLLVLPSLSEGTPVVLQEAIACGLPWAATPVGGIPDLHRSYPGGLLLPDPSDRGAVIEALALLFLERCQEGEGPATRRRTAMLGERASLSQSARASRLAARIRAGA